MDYFEKMYYRRGYHRIAGVDEVGRGPLAGPVVAAAVILPRDGIGEKLFDSKQISSKKREDLYEIILSEALGVGIGIIGQEEIDLLNIFQATLKAMALAIENLPIPPDFLLIDGPQGLRLSIPQKPIRKGDQLSNSIAAASIVAKGDPGPDDAGIPSESILSIILPNIKDTGQKNIGRRLKNLASANFTERPFEE